MTKEQRLLTQKIADALGLPKDSRSLRAVLTISADEPPKLEVDRFVDPFEIDGDQMKTFKETFELIERKPKSDAP